MKKIAALALVMCVAACATDGAKGPDARARQAASMPRLGSDEVLSRFSALPAQTLAEGECGLFLWLKREDAPLVFFQRSNSLAAEMIVDGSLRSLTRDGAERPIGMSFYEKQNFVGDDLRVNLRIAVESDRTLQGGLKVPSGMISIDTMEGWSAALPVAGAIGCK